MKNLLIIILIALAAYLISCSESELNDTEIGFSIKLSGSALNKNTADSFSITDPGGTTFIITEARANVRDIQFDYPSNSSDSTKRLEINGPFIIDLMTGSSMPVISDFEIEPGIYKRIDVRLDDSRISDGLLANTDDLINATLVLKGTFDYDNVSGRNFTFILKFNEDIRFEQPAGILVRENQANDIIVNLKVDEWLDNVNITSCIDNGEIILDSNGNLNYDDNNINDDCDDIENILKKNIKNKYDLNDNHHNNLLDDSYDNDKYDDNYDDNY